jgi:hypothetical protein
MGGIEKLETQEWVFQAEIQEMARGFRVDLVNTKQCPHQLLTEIEYEGIHL